MQHSNRPRYVDAWQDARLLVGLVEVAARFIAVTAEVFLRRGFGERYLTSGLLLGAGVLVLPLAAWISGEPIRELPRTSPGTLLYLASFLGFAVGRRAEVVRRCGAGRAWHSWCDGAPWRTWDRIGVSPDRARAVAEPLIVFAIAVAAEFAGDRVFSVWLTVTSAAMFLKEQGMRRRRREAWLDAEDRQIEDEEMTGVVLEGKSSAAARGFVMPGVERLPRSSRVELAARLRRDPRPPPPDPSVTDPRSEGPCREGPRSEDRRSEGPTGGARNVEVPPVSVASGPTANDAAPVFLSREPAAMSGAEIGGEIDASVTDSEPRESAGHDLGTSESDEAAWVDAFATFRSRTRRARRAVSDNDPWEHGV